MNALQVFIEVVESGSIIAVAHRHSLDVGFVVGQLMTLERDHGGRFFERGRKKLMLTEEGRQFMEKTRLLLKNAGGALAQE